MKLNIGIIGLGVGERHIEGYLRHPDCDVIALCDLNEATLDRARQKYPSARIVQNAEDILTDPEIHVVSVASYDDAHGAQIQEALINDKHVFAEKPMCTREKEAVAIRALLNAKPHLKLSSNLILRMCPRFRWLKQGIDAGDMGDLFYAEADYDYGRLHKIIKGWRGEQEGYSVMLGGGVHMVDLLLWLTGDTVTEVTAWGNNISSRDSSFGGDDHVVSLLKFKSGMQGKVTANFGCVRPHFHRLAAYGTKATFFNEPNHGLLYTSRQPDMEPKMITEDYPGYQKGDLIQRFVEQILNGAEPAVSEDDTFRALSVCFAADESRSTGRPALVKDL
jgi:predicted dehydrogenase